MAFYDRLKEARVNSGFTQEQLAERLGIAKSTLSGYEGGNREPTVATIAKAIEILGIDANFLYQDEMDALGGNPMQLKYNEMEHIKKYRALDTPGQNAVDWMIDHETARVAALSKQDDRIKALETEQSHRSIPRRIFAYYGKIAAAGTWVDFSDLIAGTKEYYLTDENASADYTIGVNGDSMEPTYYDGDIVFVKSANHLNVGDIGIFQKDNSIYIKEVGENGLISHKQEKYPPMINGGDVRCWGKVVGKVTEDMIIID